MSEQTDQGRQQDRVIESGAGRQQAQPPARREQGGGSSLARSGEGRMRRIDPLDLFEEMQNEMARLWANPFGVAPLARLSRRLGAGAVATPRADVFERGDRIVVQAELPGVRKEDVDLRIEDGDLVLDAQRSEQHETREENFWQMERHTGSIYRRIPLPAGVQSDKIAATLRDGVLEVEIPKPAGSEREGQKIAIR